MSARKATDNQIKAAMRGSGGITMQILANLKRIKYAKEIKEQIGTLRDLAAIEKKTVEYLATVPDVLTRQALKQRIDNNEELQQLILQEAELIDDVGETAFARALQSGEKWAVIQWLKYRGRLRQYIPATKVDHTTDDKPLPAPHIYYPAELPYNIINAKGAINDPQQTNQPETTQTDTAQQ